MRFTIHGVPEDENLLDQSRLILGAVITPFAELHSSEEAVPVGTLQSMFEEPSSGSNATTYSRRRCDAAPNVSANREGGTGARDK